MTPETEALLNKVPRGLYVDGQWQAAEAGATFNVANPATGRTLAHIADADAADGLRALDAAAAAQAEWAHTAPRVRSDLLLRAYQLVQEHAEQLALLITLEMGKPLAESRTEVRYGSEFLRWFAEESVRIEGRYTPIPEGTGTMVVTRRPVGPCYLITPWNFPLAMATRKIAPALAAGCTVVIKPAALTPLTTLYLTALFDQAGVPPGVLNVVTTTRSADVSTPLLRDTRLRKLSFTGSTSVGQTLLRQAADNVLRTSMELGGNAPFLVFDDADLDAAVDGAMAAKFRNTGQACTAANRFLVHMSIADEFTAKLATRVGALGIGPGTEPDVEIGPLIDAAAVRKTHELVSDAVAAGARIITGGEPLKREGTFFQPSIVSDVPVSSRLYREEIFGPVISITTFADEDEAITLANGTEYGLAAYAYTKDLQRAHRLIEHVEAGLMGINAGLISNAAAPFGGTKHSGMGREGGAEGIAEYLETKYSFIPATNAQS
ncbi:NAD-dependent succinate-semialdehyde dehydrogenase [Promicromonospora panici]|uniref:NAD-dependent succinate-semialdehyde dehydrogenase n=1 Tax=Promicromonospora panici TaxID=2219658 RepID=UPI00101DFC33|nr:NAD-dependent succinate-semialdehyde dehydrogenase [Promicromonospora panici]